MLAIDFAERPFILMELGLGEFFHGDTHEEGSSLISLGSTEGWMKLPRKRDIPEVNYSIAFLGFGLEESHYVVDSTCIICTTCKEHT